jgi:hypothetical protein
MASNQFATQGPPMDLANMREQDVRALAVYCLNPHCVHRSVLNVDRYPASKLVQSFGPKMTCAKCGVIGADARPLTGLRLLRLRTGAAGR